MASAEQFESDRAVGVRVDGSIASESTPLLGEFVVELRAESNPHRVLATTIVERGRFSIELPEIDRTKSLLLYIRSPRSGDAVPAYRVSSSTDAVRHVAVLLPDTTSREAGVARVPVNAKAVLDAEQQQDKEIVEWLRRSQTVTAAERAAADAFSRFRPTRRPVDATGPRKVIDSTSPNRLAELRGELKKARDAGFSARAADDAPSGSSEIVLKGAYRRRPAEPIVSGRGGLVDRRARAAELSGESGDGESSDDRLVDLATRLGRANAERTALVELRMTIQDELVRRSADVGRSKGRTR